MLWVVLLGGAFWLAAPRARGATPARKDAADSSVIQARLIAAGFENVRVVAAPGAVIAQLENRTYRWQMRGLGVALGIVCRAARPGDDVTIVVRRLDLPMLTVRVPAGQWIAFTDGSGHRPRLSTSSRLTPLAAPRPANSGMGKVDLVVGPGVRLHLVTPAADRGVQWRLNPGLEVALARGLSAEAVYFVPLDGEPPSTGRAVVSQILRPAPRLYLGLTAGQLDETRRGWVGEVALTSADGRNAAGVTVTGLSEGAWADRERPTALLHVSHRLARPDLEASVWVGEFADGDRGTEVALTSRFRDWALEVFHVKTDWTRQAGFALRIPLGPPVQPTPAPVRVRLRDYFNFRYRAPDERGACRVITGHAVADLQRDLLPVRVGQYLDDVRRAGQRDPAARHRPS